MIWPSCESRHMFRTPTPRSKREHSLPTHRHTEQHTLGQRPLTQDHAGRTNRTSPEAHSEARHATHISALCHASRSASPRNSARRADTCTTLWGLTHRAKNRSQAVATQRRACSGYATGRYAHRSRCVVEFGPLKASHTHIPRLGPKPMSCLRCGRDGGRQGLQFAFCRVETC